MSLALNASCADCHYTGAASIGGSRRSAVSYFYFPYGCRLCKKVVDVQHVGVTALKCPNCFSDDLISFNTPELWVAGEGRYLEIAYCVSTDVDFRLAGHGVAYPCPCCGGKSLHFEAGIRYD